MPATAGYAGAAALGVDCLDAFVVTGVRDVHTAIAGRIHGITDHLGGGLEHRLHDAIGDAVYGAIGVGLRGSARAMRTLDRQADLPRVEAGPRGRFVLAAINGLIGDHIGEEAPRMYFDASIRAEGRDVELTRNGVATAYPQATSRVVVFVHGLCETETYWNRRSRPVRPDGSRAAPYGERLAADHGWTPVYVRYNSGLSVGENGAALGSLLGRLVENWPTGVQQIALVGHSMGGLVIHAACAVDDQSGHTRWTDRVTDVVCLGTPHLGSYVERLAARGSTVFSRVPETAPIARVLRQRARGILDLHDGLPDIAPLPGARYRLVAATLTRSPDHPLALAVGDLLVQPRSALGRPRHHAEIFPGADMLHVAGADHFDLLNHEDVYDALSEWLARPSTGE